MTDAAGNILVSDRENNRVRVIAVRTGRFYGIAMTAGHVYTVAGGGNSRQDGTPATKELIFPEGLAVDRNGNILLGDDLSLRVVAEKSGWFYKQKMTAGFIYTVKGQAAPGAGALDPAGMAVDHAGNVVVANVSAQVVVYAVRTGRFYGIAMTAGHYYTVAGTTGGLSGDGGPATKARLSAAAAVAVDAVGNLLIADTGNNRIRVVAERTGTFYGKKMTAGDIYTVAGSGAGYFSGDGGPATRAGLSDPSGVAPSGTGLLVLDDGNSRVWAVSG